MAEKKNERLFELIGKLPNDMTELAETTDTKEKYRELKKPWYKKPELWTAAAACLCFSVAAGVLFTAAQSKYPTVFMGTSDTDIYLYSSSETTARIPRWDEMKINEQYSELKFGGNTYSTCSKAFESDDGFPDTSEKLGKATLCGYDIYEDKSYEINAEVYKIKNLSDSFAVAVKFEGENGYYGYQRFDYTPKTLGEFISDANLRENLSFNYISYEDYTDFWGQKHTVRFSAPDSEKVWELLLSDESAPALLDYRENPEADNFNDKDIMTISIDVKMPQYNNIALTITEQGYLRTNILSNGKAFYIGKDKTQAFVKYVTDNLEGYIVEYPDPAEQPQEENKADSGESYIVTYDKNGESRISADSVTQTGGTEGVTESEAAE